MGYKNNWSRGFVDESKQHVWQRPLPQNARVAIIGGGLSGLTCARELALLGIKSVVFDTGKNSVGGRCATRTNKDKSLPSKSTPSLPDGIAFDHAAQFFTVSDPRFRALVDTWLVDGVVKPWEGPVGFLGSGGQFKSLKEVSPNSPTPYVATEGMRMLAVHMERQLLKQHGGSVEVRRPCWVSQMTADQNRGWQLQGERKDQGAFDAVVIAHNGKCANRLVGPTGAPLVAKQLMGLRLSAIWAVMVAFKHPVNASFEGAFIRGNDMLSWAGNNTKKMGLQQGSVECWTLLSHNAYGQKNKVPQEAIPEEVATKVATDALVAFARALGVPGPEALPPVVFTRCQLWGAALPMNSPRVECILDARSRVGVSGDWVNGSSMEAAAVSGIALAHRLAALRSAPVPQDEGSSMDIGLRDEFHSLGGESSSHDIGGFPGLEMPSAGPRQQLQQQQQQQQQLQRPQRLQGSSGPQGKSTQQRGRGGRGGWGGRGGLQQGRGAQQDEHLAPVPRSAGGWRPAPQMLPVVK
ncbi:hypothetical protein DUNSADRAFT_18171 [Dunaliella salina]|uniref:Amine oxidase domain-containing protein n=1 Tax=Dunaliella salina TaxID=3046 RepID=A0ABQ7G0J7_DUNSA|nr:hypothetical protein DUNSADRAFT_18171 [Dunaliella salina]|eukprot:KAF5828131.1 hypothetical protein DUNSADRAFT_18171 [Dunaliella salina]